MIKFEVVFRGISILLCAKINFPKAVKWSYFIHMKVNKPTF